MTFIIHARGFDLGKNLHLFVESCLAQLLRLPIHISQVRVTLTNNADSTALKSCKLHIISDEGIHEIARQGEKYENVVMTCVADFSLQYKTKVRT